MRIVWLSRDLDIHQEGLARVKGEPVLTNVQ